MKEYLGDAVYANYDYEYVILTTEVGLPEPTNIIHLEPDVIKRLKEYFEKVGQ